MIYDSGFNNLLVKEPLFPSTVQAANAFTSGTASSAISSGELTSNIDVVDGYLQSSNFVTGSAGWKIDADGSVEFSDGTFRGAVSAATIDIGGADTSSFHVDIDGNMWSGAAAYADGVFKVSNAGALTCTNATLTGNLTLGSSNYIASGKTGYTDDTNAGFWLGDVTGTKKLNIGSSSSKYFHYDGTDLTILGGTITGGIIQTATSGYRVKLNGSTNKLELLNNDDVVGYITVSASGDIIMDGDDDVNLSTGGTVRCSATSTEFKPNSNSTYNLGDSSHYWNTLYIDNIAIDASSPNAGIDDDFNFDDGESHHFVFKSGILVQRNSI